MLGCENKTFIIAELSANHNQDFDLAVRTIKAMAEAGADAVKIQTYTPDSLVLDVDNEYFGPIKSGLWKGIKRYDLYKSACTPYEWHPRLQKVAEDLGLVFFSSPFDFAGADFLASLDVPIYKIASFEINDIPLIRHVARKGKPVIISTGVGDFDDIQLAVKTCNEVGNFNVFLLKCTSEYPAPYEQANLLTIPDMKRKFELPIGISDHTMGTAVAVASVALGAEIIEKHFILSRSLGGADSAFSMEPEEFKKMVDEVRIVEKALGSITYDVSVASKQKRRALYVKKDVKKGEVISPENIGSYRPGFGLEPKCWDSLVGKICKYDLLKGTPLSSENIDFDNL